MDAFWVRRTHGQKLALVTLSLVLVLFGDLLFNSSLMLSKVNADLFVGWFGLEFFRHSILAGHLSLWNPHNFSGTPYFAALQSGIFYPPNLVFALLPSVQAVNAFIVLHLLLAGYFMFLWARHSGFRSEACWIAGVVFALSGPSFFKTFPGHITPLATQAWIPLIFLAVEHLRHKPTLRWWLLAAGAVVLQIFAGYPQHVFYTAVAVGIYLLLLFVVRDWKDSAQKREKPASFAWLLIGGVYVAAAALTMVQLLISAKMSDETIRGGGVPFAYAAAFSFPPENFLTLLSPYFFGDEARLPYWGRCYIWEMCVFTGISGLALAFCGIKAAPLGRRRTLAIALSIALLWLLALGAHTPVFQVLYNSVPGFDKFRSQSKFITQASAFVALLIGAGAHAALSSPRRLKPIGVWCGVFAFLLACTAVWLRSSASAVSWGALIETIVHSRESYYEAAGYAAPDFPSNARYFTSNLLFIAAATAGVTTFLLFATASRPGDIRWGRALCALVVIELLVFAKNNRPVFDVRDTQRPEVAQFLQKLPTDERFMKDFEGNYAMSVGAQDVWGYESYRLRRYGEFIALIQGQNPDSAPMQTEFNTYHPLMKMLRCRWQIKTPVGLFLPHESGPAMKRLNLIPHWRVIDQTDRRSRRDAVFAAMMDKKFDPQHEVLLEQQPQITPDAKVATGSVRLVAQTSDSLDIEADLTSPQILLITDSYSKGWRAEPLEGSSQTKYQLLPANWTLRAVPLQAGHHRLRVIYDPPAWNTGKRISALALLLYLGAWASVFWQWKRVRSTVEIADELNGMA